MNSMTMYIMKRKNLKILIANSLYYIRVCIQIMEKYALK